MNALQAYTLKIGIFFALVFVFGGSFAEMLKSVFA